MRDEKLSPIKIPRSFIEDFKCISVVAEVKPKGLTNT